jgi:hypothetical protein
LTQNLGIEIRVRFEGLPCKELVVSRSHSAERELAGTVSDGVLENIRTIAMFIRY